MLPLTLFPLILIAIILITLAFLLVRPAELRVTTMILIRMLHVFFVGQSIARSSFGGSLACDLFKSCEVDYHQLCYTRWLRNVPTARSWQLKQVRTDGLYSCSETICVASHCCKVDFHQPCYTRWRRNIPTARSWQLKQVRI